MCKEIKIAHPNKAIMEGQSRKVTNEARTRVRSFHLRLNEVENELLDTRVATFPIVETRGKLSVRPTNKSGQDEH